ncbi:metal-chelation protein CHAD [Corynebacterium phocae]|uniref:Metal-chelation protein CHAD n=1 Tax=Corynebacterium phocae TaxID=161895 RepID=A0A1L7D267_9CORY|nr:CYTH and CHAD domain-containing protein [Corynebacterium phocae]APT92157.1 metal-chelation protein CHAD [Corynebacterium phocae]KAA8725943.1 CYTH and CHAD domain-containing protein [Corynebacterium phocae]
MTTTSQLEIEQKFAVDIGVDLPSLAGAAGIGQETDREEQTLSAVYFDTEDLRLTRAKVTLRRRTGGNDAGWHIKMPASAGRTEIHADLGAAEDDTEVPEVLLAHIRHLVRAHPLHPIAQVDNQRTEITFADASGTPALELCDDNVTARSFLPGGEHTQWREWEVELKAPVAGTEKGNQLLESAAAVLREAGAQASESPSKLASALGKSINNAPLPPALQESLVEPGTPAAAVVKALRANRDKLVEYDPKVRVDEWDAVHQMRVATRELRSHLQTFHGIVDGPEISHIEGELKALAGVLGSARDAEVVDERWKALVACEDSGVLSDITREHIVQDMGREYRRAHRRVVAALNSQRYLTLLDMLDQLLLDPPVAENTDASTQASTEASTEDSTEASTQASTEASTEDEDKADRKAAKKAAKKARKRAQAQMDKVMAAHLEKAYTKLVERHKKAVGNWDNEDLSLREREEYFHDMRKAAKKLRYAAEAAGKSTRLETKALYKACKKMQTVLGDFQDSVTSRDKLLRLARRAHRRGEDTFGYGLLYQSERALGLEALEDYRGTYRGIKHAFKPLRKSLGKPSK